MTDMFADRLEAVHGRALTEEERFEVDLWQKGRKLRQIVGTEGWDVAIASLQTYAVKTMDQLMSIPPGDDRIVAAHAVAYGANEVFVKFQQDIAAALEMARKAPAVVQDAYKQSTAVPPESM